MKLVALALALATAVFAVPAEEKRYSYACSPATYACTPSYQGWQVCDVSGQWQFGGSCPPDTVCKFYPPSLSPYCVPPNFQFP